VVTLVDPHRLVRSGKRFVQRVVPTYVRYPAVGTPGGPEIADAPAATGPFPLVVFAHGFAVGQNVYQRLLDSWVRAGFVVAAPEFPLTSPGAPGGPDEADVVNQPADVSLVITSLLALDVTGAAPFEALIDPSRIAVAGHSDGAETALAAADSRRLRDSRVKAAVIMSGAEMSGLGGYTFAGGSPALLAVQGTADRFNEPRYTNAYFRAAHRPKFLLRLLGAGHLPPYTTQQRDLAVVERATTAFLEYYLGPAGGSLATLRLDGNLASVSELITAP
jgi:dienelactone hydrolase